MGPGPIGWCRVVLGRRPVLDGVLEANGEGEHGEQGGERVGVRSVVHVTHHHEGAVRSHPGRDDPGQLLGLLAATLARRRRSGHRVLAEGHEVALQVGVVEREEALRSPLVEHFHLEEISAEHRMLRCLRVHGVAPGGDAAQG